MAASGFFNGQNQYHWQVDLEWLFEDDDTVLSILQGKFDADFRGTGSFIPKSLLLWPLRA